MKSRLVAVTGRQLTAKRTSTQEDEAGVSSATRLGIALGTDAEETTKHEMCSQSGWQMAGCNLEAHRLSAEPMPRERCHS